MAEWRGECIPLLPSCQNFPSGPTTDRPEQCYFEAKQIATIAASLSQSQGCQMAKFDPYLSLDCARVEGVGAQSKERKGSNFAA